MSTNKDGVENDTCLKQTSRHRLEPHRYKRSMGIKFDHAKGDVFGDVFASSMHMHALDSLMRCVLRAA